MTFGINRFYKLTIQVRGALGKAKGVQFLVWDVGGQEKLRPLWRSYTRFVSFENPKRPPKIRKYSLIWCDFLFQMHRWNRIRCRFCRCRAHGRGQNGANANSKMFRKSRKPFIILKLVLHSHSGGSIF